MEIITWDPEYNRWCDTQCNNYWARRSYDYPDKFVVCKRYQYEGHKDEYFDSLEEALSSRMVTILFERVTR
jgi:hypothetical protein